MNIKIFCFNPFQENTFILWGDNKEAIIIDPGMYHQHEKEEFHSFILDNNLIPKLLINTHAHLDHVFSNADIINTYSVEYALHSDDLPVLKAAPEAGKKYGVPCAASPKPSKIVKEGDIINVGKLSFEILHLPGHSPGSIGLYFKKNNTIIVGDVLFKGSVGRTDFTGGNPKDLFNSITQKLYKLPDNTRVYPGHGPSTTIGIEKETNQVVAYLNQ